MLQSKLLKISRTFKEGLSNFFRNGWLSFATVSVLAISLYIISMTVLIGVTANMVLKNMEEKINVSVYFSPSMEESKILNIKDQLVNFSEIKSVDYISRGQALENLKSESKKDSAIMKALEVLDENPLLAALVIKANDNSEYDLIVNRISETFGDDINRITYEDNEDLILKLNTIVKIVKQVGLTLGIVFVFIGILITFNAIRLTMYAHKQEFEIMRLVGASNMYIRMPFVFEGIFYGIVSALIVVILMLITVRYVSPLTKDSIPQGDLMAYYLSHFFASFGLLLITGITLGAVSSLIAIRRYLKI